MSCAILLLKVVLLDIPSGGLGFLRSFAAKFSCDNYRAIEVDDLVDVGHNTVSHQILDHLDAANSQNIRQLLYRQRTGNDII